MVGLLTLHDIFNLRDLTWFVSVALKVLLLFFLVFRKLHRFFPVFTSYVALTLLQTASTAFAIWLWGAQSIEFFNIAWGVQAAVICVRFLAVVEVTRHVFRDYSGVWKLASVILFALGIAVLAYAILPSLYKAWTFVVLHADGGVELCIAVFIVAMLIFARYYRLEIPNLERQLAVGFCLFSCSWVVTNAIYQSPSHPPSVWFGFFEIVAFLATMLLWINAVRRPVEAIERPAFGTLAPAQYAEISQQFNVRLRTLNDRLNHLFRSGDSRS
jgi:hypothetical protein